MNGIKCLEKCRELCVSCPVEDCRQWIESEDDLNCVMQAVKNSKKCGMTLREVGEKLNLTHVMVSFIEKAAISKIKSKVINQDF